MGGGWNRYPFSFLARSWSRAFFVGFLVLILIMTVVDRLFADYEYIRVVEFLLIGAYGLFWSFLYWVRPDFFRDE